METIRVQSDNITIPLKLLDVEQPEGLAVVSIGSNAYLILPADVLQRESVQRLAEIGEAIRSLQAQLVEEKSPAGIVYSSRKKRALKRLAEHGLPVSAGTGYGLENNLDPSVTLEKVRQELSSMAGSLTQTVVEERELS